MIDLHVHTNMSDGTLSPEEVVRRAGSRGLSAVAITDHDTVAGVQRARVAGGSVGVEVVPGVEISTEWPGAIMHILGYFIDTDNAELLEILESLRRGRDERMAKIVTLLKEHEVDITVDEVSAEAVGGVSGRPHAARIMVRKGHVGTLQEAFDRYLGRGAPAYVKKVKASPAKAVELIDRAGGIPVLAHPHSLEEPDPGRLREIFAFLQRHGLKGIEAYYPKHSPAQTALYVDLAEQLGLAVTGGTDFHGSNKPEVELGTFPDGNAIPTAILDKLKEMRRL